MIEVLQSGPLNTVQDLGRSGAMRLGIGRSGAMDPVALRLGNLLLGNAEGAAALEVVFFPFAVGFQARCAFAVTGAPVGMRLGDRRLPPDYATVAEAGEVLTLEPGREGVFAYLCVAGGLDVPVVLGSRSTDLKSGFGGLGGRAAAPGDVLRPATAPGPPPLGAGLGVSPRALPSRAPSTPARLRFIPAAEWEPFRPEAQAVFLSSRWTVGREVNRTGYRLTGPTLQPAQSRELLSHGIVPGVIQVPAGGQPIVQMVEANTCGGYPKLGVVIRADLPLLAQQRSGREVVFEQVDRETALLARVDLEDRLRTLAASLQVMRDTAA